MRAWIVLPRSGWGVGEDKQEERWTVQRKLDVVAAVESGQIPLRKAMADYLMDVEEYISWRDMAKRHGPLALRVTKLQEYTRRHPRADMRKRVKELA